MTIKFKKRALTVVGIAGFALAATAGAATFGVSTDVENAITIDVVQDMSFGTLFATTSEGTAATEYSTLVLSPDGSFNSTGSISVTAHPLLSLGGASAARGSITVGNRTPITVSVPDATPTTVHGAAATIYDPTGINDHISLRFGGPTGDPDVARFHLVNFTLGDVNGGAVAAGGSAYEYVITPSFGSNAVDFGIGATIVTDTEATALTRNTYQAGTYTGSFEVIASY